MAELKAFHECLFFPQTFDTATAKDDHVLEHFAQETCLECSQNLIRIGANLYIKHDITTCIRRAVKTEKHIESCLTESLFTVQNVSQCVSNDLQYTADLNCDDATPTKCDDQAKAQDQHDFEVLSDLIDYKNYIPHLQWGESREQSNVSSHSMAPEHPITFCAANMKVEQIEPNDQQRAFATNNLDDLPTQCQTEQKSFEKDQMSGKNSFTSMEESAPAEPKSKKFNENIRCDACNTKFKSDAIYRQHMRRKHGISNLNFKCEQCNAIFKTQSAHAAHNCSSQLTKTTGEKTIACEICGKTFNHKSSVYRHKLLLHTPAETVGRICNVCGRRFDNCEARDIHRDECALKARLRKSTSSGELQCKFCQKKFRLDESLRRHIRIKHDTNVEKFQCAMCSAIFMKEYSLQSHICPKNSEHICDICGRKLSNSRTLHTHKILKHSPPSTIFCSVCAKLFTAIAERDRHQTECTMRSKMYKLKSYGRFECEICNTKVGTKGNLRQHMRRKHDPNAENFRCKSCRTIFMNESSLEHHRCKGKPTNQSQRELISCEICGKVLQKCALSRHKILKHREPDSIFCRICVKIFPSIDELDAHLPQCKKSIRRMCNICNKILANPRVLARHKVSLHSPPGTVIFCKTCVKKFKTIDELNVHMPECTLKRKLQKFQKQCQISEDNIK